ncbi:hypothetical protein HDF14_002828 [Edaphobacter lichenicola]|uniref:Uncharacterized protein n=1 Tax=Tunturiibacter gelidiferens TaxID=3069689 RepID=A0A9X0QF34_9BACT|nr:hypothetical protein [Edaphobacter lichenicola]
MSLGWLDCGGRGRTRRRASGKIFAIITDAPNTQRGANVVVDVSNSPSFEETAALNFFLLPVPPCFTTNERQEFGITSLWSNKGHRMRRKLFGEYSRTKLFQEELIKEPSFPLSIVHATQVFDYFENIADASRTARSFDWHPSSSSLWRRKMLPQRSDKSRWALQ